MTDAAATQTHEFRAEVTALLKLVTNSLYTNREIFLRELVSNASDALDRARFQALVEPELRDQAEESRIRIVADKQAGTLLVEDNGIGMSEEEIAQNLGTIAHSGTLRFLERAHADEAAGKKPDLSLIGQFGVGFYAAFMVADHIDVHSRSAHAGHEAVRWQSRGDGTFTVEPSDRSVRGTSILLTLKDEAKDFLDRFRIEHIVKRYSNYVMHPIVLEVIGDDGKSEAEPKQVNQASAFWMRSSRDLSDDDYEEFYKHVMGGFVLPGDKPLARLHLSLDAPIQFHALLFVPGRAPADLFMEDRKSLQLYARRIMVMESCDSLLPVYFRFFRGVVDSQDLPLNVSREMLQEHQSLAAIRRQLTRKAFRLLCDTAKDDPGGYAKIWGQFGSVIKEGIHVDNAHRDELTALLRYRTTNSGEELVSLEQYFDSMPEGQEAVYYITGESADSLAQSPHVEACRARGYQVLLMTDAVDEWVVQDLASYRDKPLRSVTQGELEPETETSSPPDPGAIASAIERAKAVLGERVKDVRPSSRLTESASCLVDDEGSIGRNMERILRMANREIKARPRVLELNPEHVFVKAVNRLADRSPDDARLATWIELLYDQANLAEGVVSDPAGVVKRIQAVLDDIAERE